MRQLVTFSLVVALSSFGFSAHATVAVGQAAPDFTLTNADGNQVSLKDFKGKTVVLEWHNPECPFVVKHYTGNMQSQQGKAIASDVVWLSINSGAAGKQGNMDSVAAKTYIAEKRAHPSAYLFDGDGKVGRAYDAKTTPHMFVIDKQGVLKYMGAIDSIPSADKSDIGKATQYVSQALIAMAAGNNISVTTSKPYGCSVKY